MGSSQVLLHSDHKCIKVLGPNGSKVELNSWRKQSFGGICNEHGKTFNNLNHEQTTKHESKRTSQQTLAKNAVLILKTPYVIHLQSKLLWTQSQHGYLIYRRLTYAIWRWLECAVMPTPPLQILFWKGEVMRMLCPCSGWVSWFLYQHGICNEDFTSPSFCYQ